MGRQKKIKEEEILTEVVPVINEDEIEVEFDYTKDILKKFGKGVLSGGNSILEEQVQIIPLSPALDVLLAGGVPEGSWVNFSSKSGVGKTTTALHLAATCQKPEYGEREVFYLDIEGRLKKKNLNGIKGLNMDKFHAIRSTEEKVLSAQDFLTIGENILKNTKRSVLIVDSYSMLCHENELIGGIGTSTRGSSGYQLLAGFTRQMCQVVPVRKHIVIGIAQMMANVSGYGAASVEKGGNSIMYQADIWLRAKGMEPWENTTGKPIGQIVKWQAVKTALHGAIAGNEAESYIRFGIGIDTIRELIQFACDIALIEKNGAWYTCSYMKNHLDVLGVTEWGKETPKGAKFQGEGKLYAHLDTNQEWVDLLQKDITKTLSGQ